MVITYYGLECFKIQFGDLVLAFNPPGKTSAHKAPKFGADVAFVSAAHPDLNGVESVSFGERKPFVIQSAGEYELKGITARGFVTDTRYGGEKRNNTVYKVSLEGMTLVFLGALSDGALPPTTKSALEGADVLFIPVGGDGVLNAEQAYKLSVALEPALIVPMHYGSTVLTTGGNKELTHFLKECGAEKTAPVEKLTLKKKDVEGKDGEVVVLKIS
ncbi:MAG: Zn-dependent hydrolase [Parcubacteria group bacterium Gr01-1014_17]|nr:MAG: Zn-dependent hydrolase [Parcubacteria group bacterium Gr01-1014_17]